MQPISWQYGGVHVNLIQSHLHPRKPSIAGVLPTKRDEEGEEERARLLDSAVAVVVVTRDQGVITAQRRVYLSVCPESISGSRGDKEEEAEGQRECNSKAWSCHSL